MENPWAVDLADQKGACDNAVLTPGYNFALLLRWLARFLRALFRLLPTPISFGNAA